MTNDEVNRLRLKALRGELTPEEQRTYSEYVEFNGAQVAPSASLVPTAPVRQTNDTGSFGWAVLGFFFPLVGLILYLVWEKEKPLSAKSAGKGALAAVIVYAVLIVLCIALTPVFMQLAVDTAVDTAESFNEAHPPQFLE